MKHDEYWYHIEDGQFSYNLVCKELLGIEGNIIKLSPYEDKENESDVYILYIKGNLVECIGSIERSFPSTPYEHEEMKAEMMKLERQY